MYMKVPPPAHEFGRRPRRMTPRGIDGQSKRAERPLLASTKLRYAPAPREANLEERRERRPARRTTQGLLNRRCTGGSHNGHTTIHTHLEVQKIEETIENIIIHNSDHAGKFLPSHFGP